MAIDSEVRPEVLPEAPRHEPPGLAAARGRRSLASRIAGWAKRALEAPPRRAREFIAAEVREARSRKATQVRAIYGSSAAWERHRRLILIKAGRVEARRAAPAIAAFRCCIASLAGFAIEFALWSAQHALYEALGVLALGTCAITSMVMLERAMPTRFLEKWGFALLVAVWGAGSFVISGPVSICEHYFPNFGHANWRTVHFAAGPDGSALAGFAVLFAAFACTGVGTALCIAQVKKPAKHHPLDETFFDIISAAGVLRSMQRGRRWANARLARDVQEKLEWAASQAEKAFKDRGSPGARDANAYSAGHLLARRIREYKAPIATATSRTGCMEVYAKLLRDLDLWINDEPIALEGPDQEAAKPPRLRKLRRVLPVVLRAAVLVAAGFLVPLIPGVASSPSAVESTRVALWTAAALSMTVGGISPSDQIMGFLRGGGGKS